MAISHESLKALLEPMIDANSAHRVLAAIADIMHEKADHIRTTWKDQGLALQWSRAADALSRCYSKHIDV